VREIDGRYVLITGAGSGIGAALARRFSAEGARVIVTDIDGDAAALVAAELEAPCFRLDVSNPDQHAALFTDLDAAGLTPSIVCLNAGIAVNGSVDSPDTTWQRAWDVNVMSHVYGMREAIPRMVANGGGYIVTTASAAGLLTSLAAAPYAVTKHAAVSLAEWVAITYGDRGISVSCICPQFVDTPMLGAFSGSSEKTRAWVQSIAISPEEVAERTLEAMDEGRFLVLPHPEVERFMRNKANDVDRWIAGMQDLARGLEPDG
jgi:NAD(P)-dependent dehydrogenase (short-subunit alcohol dehydrogenase family)